MIQDTDVKSPKSKRTKRFQEFTFIGDTSAKLTKELVNQLYSNPNSDVLNNTDTSRSLLITQIHTQKNVTRQLKKLQLKPGKVVQLMSKTNNGSVIVGIDSKLVGIGSEIAQKIIVVTLAS